MRENMRILEHFRPLLFTPQGTVLILENKYP